MFSIMFKQSIASSPVALKALWPNENIRAVSKKPAADLRCTFATESGGEQKPEPPKVEFKNTDQGGRKKGTFRKFVGRSLFGIGTVTAGLVGYAWYDHEFREKVSTNVPYSKDAFDAVFVLLPESPSVPAPLLSNDKPKPIDEEQSTFMRKKPLAPVDPVQKQADTPGRPEPAEPKKPEASVAKPPAEDGKTKVEEKAKVEKVPDQAKAEKATSAKDAREKKEATAKEIVEKKKQAEREVEAKRKNDVASENAALEVAIESLVESSSTAVENALAALDASITATKRHTELLRAAMSDKTGKTEKGGNWDEMVAASDALEKAADAGDKAVAQAWESVEKLRSKVDSGRENELTKTNRILNTARDKQNKLRQELTRKIEQLSKVERDSKAQVQFKALVEKGKQQFKKELESLSPDLKLAKGGKFTDEELNLMIAHAHKRIEQLQSHLAEQAAFERQRTDLTLEGRRDLDQRLIEEEVEEEKERLKFHFDTELQEREKQIKDKYYKAMIDERYRMEEWKDKETLRKLEEQKNELTEKYLQVMEIVKINEREEFLAEMAEWIGRIKGFDRAVSARAETEELAEQAQKLWLACMALNGAIRVGNYQGDTWESQLKPLEKEVDAVFDAAYNNPFILLVLQTVPEKALTRGVFTEDNLKARFQKVHGIAKKVALIDETGGSLFKYFVSWMQSFFIASGRYTVHAQTMEEDVNIEDMEAYEILDHAKYWMDKGDLEQALRFMNLLTGESRRAAKDWIEETRLLLETRQASFTLMAFASAQGLGTIF